MLPSSGSQNSRLLTELESAMLAGVSVETIRQFQGCGLLDTVRDENNERKFREIDITTMFSTKSRGLLKSPETSVQEPGEAKTANANTPSDFFAEAQSTLWSVAPTDSPWHATVTPPPSLANLSQANETQSSSHQAPFTETPPWEIPEEESSTSSQENVSEGEYQPPPEKVEAEQRAQEQPLSDPETHFRFQGENSARVIEMLPSPTSSIAPEFLIELNKGLRDQIEVLRSERDWLRSRVEKLEARSEREQMLLLSETENVRKLIQHSEQRSFRWLRSLPWFRDGKEGS